MLIKELKIDNKKSIRKRFIIRVLFYASTKIKAETFRKLK